MVFGGRTAHTSSALPEFRGLGTGPDVGATADVQPHHRNRAIKALTDGIEEGAHIVDEQQGRLDIAKRVAWVTQLTLRVGRKRARGARPQRRINLGRTSDRRQAIPPQRLFSGWCELFFRELGEGLVGDSPPVLIIGCRGHGSNGVRRPYRPHE
jgi:hypothetical protein